MTTPVTITSLQLENVKRVKAFALSPAATGLTVIGGKNKNGKTSVLDAICWALGGAKFEPSNPQRDGAMNPPKLEITLSNGLVVERKGKNSALTVTDPTGAKHGQQLLDSLVSAFALDLPKFLHATDKEKAQILLQVLGIGDQLAKLEQEEKALYDERHAVGKMKLAKRKHAEELPEFGDAPEEPISVSALIQQQQSILATNGENQRKREQAARIERDIATTADQIADLEAKLATLKTKFAELGADLITAQKSAAELNDESTAEIEASLANIETINAHVAANQAKAHATDEADQLEAQYDGLTARLEAARAARLALLDGAALPLPGMNIEGGVLTYQGKAWDCMSGAEQLQVGAATVRKLKPECGFVLMDELEKFDVDTLSAFGAWLVEQGLQAIATRVSTGQECTIIIEDGLPAGQTYLDTVAPLPEAAPVITEQPKQWEAW